MSTEVVSPLRQRMIEDMNARKVGAHSQRSHIYSCRRLAAFLKRSPDTATPDDVRRFQLHLAETGMSISNRNRIMTGVKFLFRVTLRRLDLVAEIYHLREPQKIPQVMSADERCRTAALGGHVARCEDCEHTVIAYNSCRNRHCPKCQGAAAQQWLAEREADLLPVGYFHVVFTLPAAVADIAYHNKAAIYDLLLTVSAEA